MHKRMKRRSMIITSMIALISILLVSCGSITATVQTTPVPTHKPTPTPTFTPTPTPSPSPTPTYLPTVSPSATLGVVADAINPFHDIPWVRVSYVTCVRSGPSGAGLKATIAKFHSLGVRVMLSVCQWAKDSRLYNTKILNDAAQGAPDAVQCGNEQMKTGAYNLGVSPDVFAKFFDLCQQAMHAVRPGIPIIIGSNDPHVGGIDYYPLIQEVNYFNAMQYAMNTWVHPGGNWNWRSQIIGLIDSWHNGYPNQSVNSLYGLYLFWAQQFGVNLNSGDLGKHLWVIEGTGCIYGCGIATDSYHVAVSHILTLITDVQTTMRYKVPFFYFSARDFGSQGQFWPMGVRDLHDGPKPLRQDLWMGARTLRVWCPYGHVTVSNQEQLLARLYSGCSLPGDYIAILEN
jgi:hypothetical protein